MSSLLQPLSSRLSVTGPATLRKAEEFLRLLEVQARHLDLSTSARTIICLDIAAASTNTTLDKKLAIKLSGLTRSQYVALSQTVTQLLNLTPKVTVADLCNKYSVPASCHLAQLVLALYGKEHARKGMDLSLPAYPTAAVQASCSILKVKVSKQQLYECSGTKKALYIKLVEAMTALAQRLHTQQASKSNGKRGRTLMELVEENLKECSPEKRKKTSQEEEEEVDRKTDNYEGWKSKILKATAVTKE